MHFHRKLFLAILLITLTMAGAASAQTLSIVSGDGQVSRQFDPFLPLIVIVRDTQGQPMQGVTVNWVVNGSQGSLHETTVTDASGLSSNTLVGAQVSGANYAQISVTASIPGSAVTFVETIAAVDVSTNTPLVPVQLLSTDIQDRQNPLTGSAGSTGTSPILLQVGSNGLQGVSHVLIQLTPDRPDPSVGAPAWDPDGPSINCSPNSSFTDVNGNVSCSPVFGGKPGTGQYFIVVGGKFTTYGPFSFAVTKGAFTTFRITGGNNQSGSPGAVLPLKLTARAEDAAGNAVSGVSVVWEPVVAGTVALSQTSSISDASGNVSATATLGGSVGAAQVRLKNLDGTIQVLFTETVNLQVTGLTKIAGDNQDAVVNSLFTQPLIVEVRSQGPNNTTVPASGVTVTFSSSSGVSFPNGPNATTTSDGRASINVRAGSSPGAAIVTAAIGNFSLPFNLTIRLAGPGVNLNSFFNGAGGQPGGVSPAAVLSIYGSGIATGLQGCVAANQIVGPLPIQLSNVTVLFDVPNSSPHYFAYGPLYSVCNLGAGQEFVSLQVPADLPLGSTNVTVSVGSSTTTVQNVPVTPFSPGIFETVMSDGVKRAVLLHADGSYVQLDNKARPGETLRAFVTGLGRPVTASGQRLGSNRGGVPGDDASPTQPIVVGVANQGVRTVSAVYAPYFIGVYIVTFEVQANPPIRGDNSPFAVAVLVNDNLQFGNPSKIPIVQ